MANPSPLDRALDMVRDLRARCAWDRAQTRETLRPYLVEEVLEVDHALGEGDPATIRDELGDFLLHLAWQLVLAEERDEFTADQVADDLVRKMQRRHPHLFDLGDAEPWEVLKRRERAKRRRGLLDGLPRTLPPLLMAYRLQERAASVGFDWPDVEGPLAKVKEELAETEAELRRDVERRPHPPRADQDYTEHRPGPRGGPELAAEIGDLLFAVVNLARKAGVDPRGALDSANRKFTERFAGVERLAEERGIDLHTAGLEALDRLWDEVKAAAPVLP